jgi:glycosyltransferase involved in cell wall biosynthesis
LRIVHIDSGRQLGGGQWQVLRLLGGLREHGCESILMAQAPLAELAAKEGFPVEKVSRRIPAADLVHAHDARAHTLAAVFSRRPLIVARRVAFPIKQGWLSRWKYRRASHFIAVSQFVARILMDAGIPPCKISIVHDGVPLLPLSSRDGPVLEMVKNASNLEQDLLHARLLVYLSEAEGLGSGALLGMSAGVPVIASRVGGLPEAIQDGVNGILTSNDPTQVAACVARLESDPQQAARLGANARLTIEERFTVERMVDDTLSVYRRILNA